MNTLFLGITLRQGEEKIVRLDQILLIEKGKDHPGTSIKMVSGETYEAHTSMSIIELKMKNFGCLAHCDPPRKNFQ
jgi:hypothetical protein